MPSIIGTSTVLGFTLSFTGPTGFDGPTGPRGPIGPSGLTLGPTGSTGFFIQDVLSDTTNNRISFVLSDGRVIGPMFGFTGPTVNIKDSRGISSAFDTNYKGFILGVCGGYTFEFRGVCGDGNIVFPALSTDGTEIILGIGTITGGVSYGNTASNFLVYSTPAGTISATKITVNDQTWVKSETSTDFLTDQFAFGQNLSLGFTTSAIGFSNTKSDVQVFADFTETYLSIPSIGRSQALPQGTPLPGGISGIDSGGYILDLNRSSVFKLATPIGITAFHVGDEYKKSWIEGSPENTITNSWLLFVDGSDVWNLPSNLIFTGVTGGLGSFGFCDGMNILRVQSDYSAAASGQEIYYATFVDRCFGANPPVDLRYPDIGSCCSTNPGLPTTCVDYVTRDHCERILGGAFNHLKTCRESCNIGSCCLNGVCRDNVSKEVCEHYLGVFDGAAPCLGGDGSPCVGGVKTYTLNKQNTTEPSSMLSSASRSAPQKIGEIVVLTNDPVTTISMPSFITDSEGTNHGLLSFRGTSSTFGTDIDGSGNAVINSTSVLLGVTFGIYFDNNANSITDRSYPITSLPVSLKDSSGVEQASVTFNVKPAFAASCGGVPTAVRIRTAFTLERFCHDCYFDDSDLSVREHYPVQQQSGTFDYCYDTATGNRTPLCASSTAVDHVDNCNKTDAAFDTDTESLCVHFDHEFTARTRGMSCAPCLNAAEDGCGCGDEPCCCGTCFKPQMDPASPNYGRCVFSDCADDPTACAGFIDGQGNRLALGTPFPDAEVCSGGSVAGRDGTVLRKSGTAVNDFVSTCRGAIGVTYLNGDGTIIIPDPYWFTPKFYPNEEALQTQLYFAGITTASGISAEISWIKTQLENIVNPTNSKQLYFTPENTNKNIILNPGLGITCCNFEEYDTSYVNEVLVPVDYTPPAPDGATEFEVKYIVVNGVGITDIQQRCLQIKGPWYDIYNRKIENPGCKQICLATYKVSSEALFLRCIFVKNANPPQLSPQHTPCLVKPLRFEVNCGGIAGQASVVFRSQSSCPGNGFGRYEVAWPLDSGLTGITELQPQNAITIGGQKFAKIVSSRIICGATGSAAQRQGQWWREPRDCWNTHPQCDIKRFLVNAVGDEDLHPWTRRWLSSNNSTLCTNLSFGRWAYGNARNCSTQTINGLTKLPNMTTENALFTMAYLDEIIWKPRYCPCDEDTTSSNYCQTYNCQFLGESCAPSVSQYIQSAVPENYQNCNITANFKKYALMVSQGSDNSPAGAVYTPKLYEIDMINRTTTLTDHWLYYSTGRLDSCGSNQLATQNTDQGFVPNIRKIRSGENITISDISTLPLGAITVYWDGLTGANENFFNRSTPIQKIVKVDPTFYINGLGESTVYENMPVESPYTTWDIEDLGNGTFNLVVTLHPETTIVPISQKNWTICSWAYILWTKKKPNAVNPSQPQTFISTGDQSFEDPTLNYDTDFKGIFGPFKYDDFTTTDGFSDATWIKFELTTKLIITKDIKTVLPAGTDTEPEGNGVSDYRVIERTEYIKALRPGVPNPVGLVGGDGAPPPNASRKLLTVDGLSTCVEIDCDAIGGCFDLPDC